MTFDIAMGAAAAANQTTDGSFTPDDALLMLEIIGLVIILDYFFGGPDDA